jgi:hypothetical protein
MRDAAEEREAAVVAVVDSVGRVVRVRRSCADLDVGRERNAAVVTMLKVEPPSVLRATGTVFSVWYRYVMKRFPY